MKRKRNRRCHAKGKVIVWPGRMDRCQKSDCKKRHCYYQHLSQEVIMMVCEECKKCSNYMVCENGCYGSDRPCEYLVSDTDNQDLTE